jgi:hypothetical protein
MRTPPLPKHTQPAFGDLVGKRLQEMVQAGWLTRQEWHQAVRSGPVSLHVIVQYLARCLAAPDHGGPTA